MLKTNSKKAKENIKKYIIEYASEEFTEHNETFNDVAREIYKSFTACVWNDINDYRYFRSEQNAFEYWASGLPSALDTCYYYNRSAIKDLGDILEQSETERAKYTQSESEKLLTYLIFREIKNAIK